MRNLCFFLFFLGLHNLSFADLTIDNTSDKKIKVVVSLKSLDPYKYEVIEVAPHSSKSDALKAWFKRSPHNLRVDIHAQAGDKIPIHDWQCHPSPYVHELAGKAWTITFNGAHCTIAY